MGFWSGLLGAAPAPVRRKATALFGRGYNASQLGRRLRGWDAERRTINALLAAGGEQLRARSRQLCRENPYASSACESFTAAGVGSGIKPSSLHGDADTQVAIQDTWLRWTDEADADGLTDFYGLQALATRGMFEAGEVFVRFRPRRPSDGLSVPLQLQLLESEMLSFTYNGVCDTTGNIIREGIEFDPIGRRVAYHFYKSHPGEIYPVIFDFSYNRVPASEVLHLYKPLRPGQIRGQPQITPSMVRLYLLDLYDDAELDRKKVAAMFAGFVTKKSPTSDTPLELRAGEGALSEPVPPGSAIAPLEPGMIQVLEEGEDITFSNPTEVGGSYEAFQWRNLLAIAAGCGVPYFDVTSDTSQSNYSSSREAQVAYRRRMDQFQHQTLVFQLCRPVWQRWFAVATLTKAIPIAARDLAAKPAETTKVKWIPPKWEWVDPFKDRKAAQIAVQEGWISRSDVIEAEGEEPIQNDKRIQADRQRELAMDLGFRPATIRENVNIAASADSPDAAVKAATSAGDAASGEDGSAPAAGDPLTDDSKSTKSGAARSGGAKARARALRAA